MKLYSYWRSTAAYRVRIALAIKDIDYETVIVNLVKEGGEQHKQPYQQLNPSELVPTLVDGDAVISQSSSIIEYLEERFPVKALLPVEPVLRAQIRAMAQSVACDIHPLNNLRVLQYLKAEMSHHQEQVDVWYKHWIKTGFIGIEKVLENTSGSYCFGNQLSLADVFLVPQVYNANRFHVPLDDFPLIQKINKQCLELEEFQQASPENQPDAES